MTTHGTHNNVSRLATVHDLDAMLAQHTLVPAVITLGGHNYNIRTDLTPDECRMFLDLGRANFSDEALTILVGTKAERDALTRVYKRVKDGDTSVKIPLGKQAARLSAYMNELPRMHSALVSSRIMQASKALAQNALTPDEVYAQYNYTAPDTAPELVESGESSAS